MRLILLFAVLLIWSCDDGQEEDQETAGNETPEVSIDTLRIEKVKPIFESFIGEPFLVQDIDGLNFTAGGGPSIKNNELCDTLKSGFFGSYFLIDPGFEDENGHPTSGTIIVHVTGKMKDWKSIDSNQTIWKINLKSDVISVWDSIHVGLSRKEIEDFSISNNGHFKKRGPDLYSCAFNKFSVDYLFKNETLKELSINRNCDLEMSKVIRKK